jgi:hypothetical protein
MTSGEMSFVGAAQPVRSLKTDVKTIMMMTTLSIIIELAVFPCNRSLGRLVLFVVAVRMALNLNVGYLLTTVGYS